MSKKTAFSEGWPWFKFNKSELALGMALKFYTSVAKELKLKVRTFCWLIPTFAEVIGEKLVRGKGDYRVKVFSVKEKLVRVEGGLIGLRLFLSTQGA